MSYKPTPIRLSAEQKSILESWIRSSTAEQRLVFRAKIIMMADEGKGTNAIAAELETRPATVTKWRMRFARLGLDGLKDAPRPGQPQRYLPENALVVCVDEKPHIQALERAQGYLRMPNGRALRGFSHEYKRHGTTTLFAALETATGQVIAGHYQRRRRVQFLDFMNRVVGDHADREIHVIMDNLSTHKPKRDLWLARHKNVHFHFIPTHASWLNQVEVWFSLLSRYALRGASFNSPKELREAIDRFIAAYNPTAHPFEWTKRVVHPKSPERHYADLCN